MDPHDNKRRPRTPPYTLVSFHAHPDDEALLTGGTLARSCAQGHRVVIVCATDGEMGLASAAALGDARGTRTGGGLGSLRREELQRAAAALGCTEVRFLDYPDSGFTPPKPGSDAPPSDTPPSDTPPSSVPPIDTPPIDTPPSSVTPPFSQVPTAEAAHRLAAILVEVDADAITIYDPAGGYGHPDHVAVHEVGVAAAAFAGTPIVLEATVDRRLLTTALRVLDAAGITRLLGVNSSEWEPRRFESSFTEPGRITHSVRVGRYAKAKRAAMAAHGSQAAGGTSLRTLAVFARLPLGVFRAVFAREWFVERDRTPRRRRIDDIFDSVRAPGRDEPRSGGRWRAVGHRR